MPSPAIIAAAHGPTGPDAVALAVDLARLHDACVLVTGIYVVPAGPYARSYEQAARHSLAAELERLAEAVPAEVPHTTLLHASTSVVHGLHELAASEDALTVVLGATHKGAVGRALHGDPAAGLLHDAPCAVAVAPAGWAAARRHLGDGVVGVAWDDGGEAQTALAEAVWMAKRTETAVRILHAVEPLPTSSEVVWADDEELELSRHRTAHALVDEVAATVHGCGVETEVLEGPAARALADASGKLGVLVVGSRAYGALRRVLFGSVSSRLVRDAQCPVLILPRGERPSARPVTGASDSATARG